MRAVIVILCVLTASTGVAGRRAIGRIPDTLAGAEFLQTDVTPAKKTAGEAYKNIQVFKNLPESQLIQAMFFMKASLGVECTHCHVDFVNFEKDDKPAKQVAREMIRMVLALNRERFDDRALISCNTCHRGQSRPSAPLAFAPIAGPSAPSRTDVPSGDAKPTVDQVFERYIDATGGKIAQQHVSTVVLTGSKTTSEGWTAPLEIDQKGPGKSLETFELKGPWRSSFNGTAGWGQDNQGVHSLDGEDLALFRLKSSFFRPSTLRDLYNGLAFAGTDVVSGHPAYVIEGTLTGAGPQKLFFDVQSGRLVRITASTVTPFGPLPEEFDLDDYRSVGGVILPFATRDLKPDFSQVDRVDKVRTNVPIDDRRFERPSSADAKLKVPIDDTRSVQRELPGAPEHATSRSYNRALGVECSYCHSMENLADAGKPTFDFARRMARMASGLGDGPLKDLGGVTCWSCHRGHAIPSRLPPEKWQSIAKAHAADLSGGRQGLDLTMSVYSASLGVECSHCHVDGNWSDGSRRGYQMAGRMVKMFDLMPSFFEGSARQPRTQCYMCHQGSVHVERD